MTREEATRRIECCRNFLASNYSDMGEPNFTAFNMAIKALEQETVLDKIFYIIYPLSIMSTPELEHKAIMQIAEMLEPLCLPESEDQE